MIIPSFCAFLEHLFKIKHIFPPLYHVATAISDIRVAKCKKWAKAQQWSTPLDKSILLSYYPNLATRTCISSKSVISISNMVPFALCSYLTIGKICVSYFLRHFLVLTRYTEPEACSLTVLLLLGTEGWTVNGHYQQLNHTNPLLMTMTFGQ